MKKIVLTTVTLMIGMVYSNAQNVNIPDVSFKAYLVGNTAINTNADSEIQVSEAEAFTGAINCDYINIYDLTGIEAFTQLTTLQIPNNYLTEIDLSSNTGLLALFCAGNLLTSLDLSNNTSLTYLSCHVNQLTSLNLKNGNNTNMTHLECRMNANLLCIEVDDASYSTMNWTSGNYLVDDNQYFSENCSLSGLTEEKIGLNLLIYPNPASSDLTIETKTLIENIEIFDINGSLVQNETTNNFSVASLTNGVYFIHVKTNEGVSMKRFIKE